MTKRKRITVQARKDPSQPSAVFRTNASSTIGMGHLLRCLTIAEELVSRGWKVQFVIRKAGAKDPYGPLNAVSKDLLVLPPGTPPSKDLKALTDLVSKTRPNVTIVDSYEVDEGYLEAIQNSGSPVAYIDDLARIRSGADLILNYNAGFGPKDYRQVKGAKVLLGLRYCPLNRRVRAKRSSMSKPPKQPEVASTLLLTLGAGEHAGTFNNIMAVLAKEPWLKKVNITTKMTMKRPPKKFVFLGFRKDFPSVIARHRLAISAGGSTSYQLACLGVPAIIYVLADNQLRVAKGLDRIGLGRYLGPAKSFSARVLSEEVSNLAHDKKTRERMALKAFRAVDGFGATRIAEDLERMFL